MRDTPLISIIIPVYNSEQWLEKCVFSILNQSYNNLEIILVDDGSTDQSGTMCDQYRNLDQRVRVYHKENGGQATARNLGLKMASGSYIGFVDSDDWIDQDMYSTLIDAAVSTKADIVMCGRRNVTPEGTILQSVFTCDDIREWNADEALRRFFLYDDIDGAGCDKIFKRELLEGIEYPVGLICEDLPFICTAIQRVKKIVHVGKPMYNYVQRMGSTSHSSFSPKTEGLIIYPRQMRKEVVAKKKYLQEEADYYYFFNAYLYYQNYYLSKVKNTALQRLGCQDLFKMLRNRHLPKRKKLMLLMYQSRILGSLWGSRY